MSRLMVSLVLGASLACAGVGAQPAPATPVPSMADILARSPAGDWRTLDPGNTLYLQLPTGRVVIELAPTFAPNHVANIKQLVHDGYFDGLAIVRVQDNYVVQWADPDEKRSVGSAHKTLKAEFTRTYDDSLDFTPLPDPDTYAAETGISSGFPTARDPATHTAWLAHCYGMVGAGRDNGADTGGGTELYAVIGHAPRQLDRNVTLVGRVVQGIDLLSAMPRGTEALGFYKTAAERIPIKSVRLASDVPAAERLNLEALRTDSETFKVLLQSRRFRKDDWYLVPAGHLDLCNVPLPVRVRGK